MGEADYRERVRASVLDEDDFIRATFSGQSRGEPVPWRRVVLRPVELKGGRHLQFSYFDAQKNIVKNYQGDEAEAPLDDLLAMAFKNIHVESRTGTLQINMSKKGRPLVSARATEAPRAAPDLAHDREKQRALPADGPDPFLQAIGIMTQDGTIRADMQHKYRQINQFLHLIKQTGELSRPADRPLHLIDYGAGNAYLTFAVYHYLNETLGIPTTLTGIDVKADLMAKHRETAAQLGWEGMRFVATRIEAFTPEAPPDVVLALHACDTATDDALAQGIRWGARLIFSVPCCHHHLQAQLRATETPTPFRPVMRHGILLERQGDILTDAFRAHILRIMGYQTDVVQFVSAEHTAKNLMIRAVKSEYGDDVTAAREYVEMKAYWGVTPYLEELLGDLLTLAIASAAPDG